MHVLTGNKSIKVKPWGWGADVGYVACCAAVCVILCAFYLYGLCLSAGMWWCVCGLRVYLRLNCMPFIYVVYWWHHDMVCR